MHSSVVKLFTRRAAAHVELHDLQSAKADFAQVGWPGTSVQLHTLMYKLLCPLTRVETVRSGSYSSGTQR